MVEEINAGVNIGGPASVLRACSFNLYNIDHFK